jgi:hypothetical protein
MSTLKVNAVTDASGGNTATINSMTPTADSLQGFRNRIINGDMRIDQRNAGASVTGPNGYQTVDRFGFYISASNKFNAQQNAGSVTPPTGFVNYLGITSSSAYSVLTADFFVVQQTIEGTNIADLAWGTASAKTVTLSFWVRSSLTGTFGGALANSAFDRSYPFTYSISSANTWEQKTITITGDTSGTWLTTNGIGIRVMFGLGVGSTGSGTAGSWSGVGYYSATGATSVVGTNGATFYITGVQLEVGSVATPFERRDYGRELIMCQRYFFTMTSGSSAPANDPLALAVATTTTDIAVQIRYPTTMRTDPTVYSSLTVGDRFRINGNVNVNSSSNPTNDTPGEKSCTLGIVGFSGLTVGYAYTCRQYNVTGVTGLDAEL